MPQSQGPARPFSKPRLRSAAAALIVLLFILAGAASFAQTYSGALRGTVTDPSGSAVPGASIDIRNAATNDIRRTSSDASGRYEFANLPPGEYELQAQATGFKTFVRSNMVLQIGVSADMDVMLELGPVAERVEVSAQAVLVDTDSADHKATLNAELISALPTFTRSPLNFVFAMAGVTEAQAGMTQPGATVDQMFSMFGLQGGRTGNASILLDGAPNTAIDWGGLMVSPTVDGVAELQIVRNTYDAEYAKGGFGVISMISKGGTNDFHGLAYDYLQNDDLNAMTWADNKAGLTQKPEMKRNQFGGNIGGPIWKRKNLFFFGAYEGLRQPFAYSSGFQTLPTALEKQGDFSKTFNADGTPQIVYNPFSTRQVTDANGNTYYTRDPFPGNKIPQSMMDAAGMKVASLYPDPNRAGQGPNQINNYYKVGSGNVLNDKVEWRVDWAQNEKHRIFARMTQRVRQSTNDPCFYCNGADPDYYLTSPGWQAVVNDTITPSPNWIINGLISASRWAEGQQSFAFGKISPGDLGLRPADYQIPVMPSFNLTGYNGLGNDGLREQVRYTDDAEVNVTRQFSKHTVKFGGTFQLSLINNRDAHSGGFNFGRDLTSCDPNGTGPCQALNYGSNVSGNSLASLLLGTGGGTVAIVPDKAMSVHYYGTYIQDSWRVNQRLTVNLGLRYENQRPATERYNRMAFFDPHVLSPMSDSVSEALGRPLYGGFEFASPSNRFAWPAANKDFAPRIGLAYKVTDKLVARAGFGIFYSTNSAMISFDQGMFIGYSAQTGMINTQNSAGYIPAARLSDAFPSGVNQPTGNKDGLMTFVNQGINEAWVKQPYPTPYKSHFSFDLQYQLKAGSVLEVGYTGWRARKLMYGNPDLNIDQLDPKYLSMGDALNQEVPNPFYGKIPDGYWSGQTITYNQLLRQYPQYGWLTMTRSTRGAIANFNALNVKFQHQFSGGLNLMSTYQYSKVMDNGSEDLIGWAMGSSWRDAYHTNLDYSISAHDVPHSFVNALLYDLPVGKGKKFASSAPGFVNQIIGGWQVSGIVTFHTGMPVFPVDSSIWSNQLWSYGFPGPERPNLVGNPKPAHQTTEQWINPAAFAAPAPYTIGNAPRYIDALRESATKNFDMALAKNFKAERFNVQFRAEFLNAFNTPVFGGGASWWANIQNCMDCGMFGQVIGTRNPPRNVQLALRLQF